MKRIIYKSLMILIGILMMADYMFTYYGVKIARCVEEANPFMRGTFEVGIVNGSLIRIFTIAFILGLMTYLYKLGKYKELEVLIFFGLSVNIYLMLVHYNWLTIYLQIQPIKYLIA